MAKTEKLLQRIAELERETGIRRTLFAACPNSTAVIKAAFRAAKRNNAPIYFAATLNQIDCDGGYTGMRPDEFVKLVRMEAAAVNFEGIYIVAIDHGGPWLKDKQRTEKWSTEAAMDGVKRSFEAALLAGDGVSARVVKLNRVAPLDSDGICRALDGVKRIVAAEDQLRAGAVGERLGALLLEQGAGTEKLVLRSVGTTLPSQGSTVELRHALGLDAEGIAQAVLEVLA